MSDRRPPRKWKNRRPNITINERLRADKSIITERGNAGLARLLFALRTAAAANKISLFEQVFGCKTNAITETITEKSKNCSENDEALKLSPGEFPNNDDSTLFLRDRTKNTKLEGQFKKDEERLWQSQATPSP